MSDDAMIRRGDAIAEIRKQIGAPKPRDTRITEKAHHTALMAQAANFYRQRDFLITALKEVEQGTTSYNSVMKLFEVLWPGETAAPTKE